MVSRIDGDVNQFRQIVKGKIRRDLGKYIAHGRMTGRKGKDVVSIPVPSLDLPHFRHGENGRGGVGQGDGEVGQPIGQGENDGDGTGQAGGDEGQHMLEVEVNHAELAKWLQEFLELPNIEPKGKNTLESNSIKKVVPRHTQLKQRVDMRRTLKEGIARQMASGGKVQDLIIQKPDMWNRDFETEPNPEASAAVVHMLDVSGSVTDEMKEIVRTEAWWTDLWLKNTYPGLLQRYIIFDAKAEEVDEHTFYHTTESGGTRISTSLEIFKKMIETNLSPDQWNLYGILYSDGDNWEEDNEKAFKLITELAEIVNLFGYNQTNGEYGTGEFGKLMKRQFKNKKNVRITEIAEKDEIPDALKIMFGKKI